MWCEVRWGEVRWGKVRWGEVRETQKLCNISVVGQPLSATQPAASRQDVQVGTLTVVGLGIILDPSLPPSLTPSLPLSLRSAPLLYSTEPGAKIFRKYKLQPPLFCWLKLLYLSVLVTGETYDQLSPGKSYKVIIDHAELGRHQATTGQQPQNKNNNHKIHTQWWWWSCQPWSHQTTWRLLLWSNREHEQPPREQV